MIIFCEDCGERNQVSADQLSTGKAIFTCIICGYKNCFAFDSAPRTQQDDQDLETFLDSQIEKNPDCMGGLICNNKNEIIVNRMPASLSEKDVNILCRCLCRGYHHGTRVFDDIEEVQIEISNKIIRVLKNTHELFLVLIGLGPAADISFIADDSLNTFKTFRQQN